MAHKPKSFKLDEKNKAIIIYTNSENAEEESVLRDFYLKEGYKPLYDKKKKGISVAEMREELKADEETLKEFNKAYAEKNGFHTACKIYTKWKKENK